MLIEKEFYIEKLKRKRTVMIYLPDDYQNSQKSYPVLYINDGQNAFFDESSYIGQSWGFLEHVKRLKLEIIMVAIPCNFEEFKREDEYGPFKLSKRVVYQEMGVRRSMGGEGKQFLKFIKDDVKRYIDNTYRTIKDDCAMVGSSMGALFSLYALLEYPSIFSKVALLSTPFWLYQKEYQKMINKGDFSKTKVVYQDLGGQEGQDNDKYYQSNLVMKSLLENKINNYHFRYFEDDDHSEYSWYQRVPIFLELFYKDEKE